MSNQGSLLCFLQEEVKMHYQLSILIPIDQTQIKCKTNSNIKTNHKSQVKLQRVRIWITEGNESFSKANPLRKNIKRGHIFHTQGPRNIRQASPIKSPSNTQTQVNQNSYNPNPNNQFRTLNKEPVRASYAKTNNVIHLKPNTNTKPQEDFILPDDCYFINEKREDLPFDPVELSKLKLIKKNAIKNLERRIQNIKKSTSGDVSQNQIDKYNQELSNLDSKIADVNKRIESMKTLKQKRPSQGYF